MEWRNRCIDWLHKVSYQVILKYKCKKFGRKLEEIDESYTTQDCFNCGRREKKLLSQRIHKCGFECDRDINSALNILKRFLLGLSHQDLVGLNLSNFWLDTDLVMNSVMEMSFRQTK